ncbi:NUDIX hydrolase [Tropicimonas isoalkanivorans]|uniref:Nudix hydrolase domain-containing protein n=1 Tax=Tropicimonas isoalkanivorans TaxID=441112 RepID=A0A1I1HYH2_9RHOB|nr:NUDIX hydrolase [Tropicimonas isoalkanivorans]SFC28891.1 hypothetical protein SAMN04488094_103328 [Tropicimonas isoalkanivorans]
MTDAPVKLRDAATIVLSRRDSDGTPRVLMGQRGKGAVFMPNKFVFPGGAVDAGDANVPLDGEVDSRSRDRLHRHADATLVRALQVAAVRELWEETGMMLGVPGRWSGTVPADWAAFADMGKVPSAAGLSFLYRAVTPHGQKRRFDARFFWADEAALQGNEDFRDAPGELSALSWVSLTEARALDLPMITHRVLLELEARMTDPDPARKVPFFDGEVRAFSEID